MKWPSGLTVLTGTLLVLLPALAVLQYRWVGQVSDAAEERMQTNLRNAASQFREAFDGEIARAFLSLQVGPATARDGSSERYSDRYDTWINTAAHPQIVARVFLVDVEDSALRLRHWNATTHTFDATPWPAVLEKWRPYLEQQFAEFDAGLRGDGTDVFRNEDTLLVAPLRLFINSGGRRVQATSPMFGFTIVELDREYIRSQFLPALAQRYFTRIDGGDGYRLAVTVSANPSDVIYRSDPAAPADADRADAVEPLLGRLDPIFVLPGSPDPSSLDPRRPIGGDGPRASDRQAADRAAARDSFGRWRLYVQHQSGSLEAAVAQARRRNLAISFGILLLLSISVAVLTVSSRRAQRLAQQQMEFVAGVSHELRTPVAVIRSAAENLSHGVVGSVDRVKRYGQMIESESRRLGEMVERILQFAGIESGLGLVSREPLAVADIVGGAIDGSLPLLGDGGVEVQRDIPVDLPPVVGDAAALRSAVQNLIANAVKYGGADGWVGIRAEQVRHRRSAEVHITVSDHGDGIPAAELPHIFEPFYRGADAIRRQVHGNGLGLSLVKRIVAAHGGRVTVTSRAGVGSTFTIALPAAEADARSTAVATELGATVHS